MVIRPGEYRYDLDTLVLGPGITASQVGVYRVANGADLDLALPISATDTVWIKPGSPYNVLSGPQSAYPALKCHIQSVTGLLAWSEKEHDPVHLAHCGFRRAA